LTKKREIGCQKSKQTGKKSGPFNSVRMGEKGGKTSKGTAYFLEVVFFLGGRRKKMGLERAISL